MRIDWRDLLQQASSVAASREDLWLDVIKAANLESMAEVGIFRGDFSARLLAGCPSLSRYTMIDPWRHLETWSKPANVSDEEFDAFMDEALEKTEFARQRRSILRGTTQEAASSIADGSLDVAYIDGDHTLRGITIDLVKMHPKIRSNGLLAGDDFTRSMWQHESSYEPSAVFPFAVHFAEAMADRIFALPYNQFAIEKTGAGFSFVDLTGGGYADTGLRKHLIREAGQGLFSRMAKIFSGTPHVDEL